MSSSDPNIYFKKIIEEKTEDKEEEQLEQYVHEIVLSTISSLKTVHQPVEEKKDNNNLIESREKSIVVQNKIIPSTTQINPHSVQIRKQHKAIGPGIIYAEDGKTIINLDQKCPPIPCCEGFEAKKCIPQRVILVYPVGFFVNTTNERGERIPEVFADDEVTRQDFFVDILTILIIQMILTFSFIFACDDISTLRDFLKNDHLFYICALVMNVLLFILLMCFEAVRKISPFNYLVIALFTLCTAYLLGYMHAIHGSHKDLLFSVSGTLIILIIICIIAWTNCYDFSTWFYTIVSLLFTGLAFYIIAQVYFRVTGSFFLMYCFYGIFISIIGLSLLHQFQLLLGEGRYAIETDEYIFAALVIYLHINILYTNFRKLLEGPQN